MTYVPLEQRPPAKQREALVFIARAHLNEARARRLRGSIGFCHTLLGWARNARKRAAAIDLRPQGDLFEATARMVRA